MDGLFNCMDHNIEYIINLFNFHEQCNYLVWEFKWGRQLFQAPTKPEVDRGELRFNMLTAYKLSSHFTEAY